MGKLVHIQEGLLDKVIIKVRQKMHVLVTQVSRGQSKRRVCQAHSRARAERKAGSEGQDPLAGT